MKTLLLTSIFLLAATGPLAMAQTAQPPAATEAAKPLTADEVKTIERRLQQIEREIEKEYTLYQQNRGGTLRGIAEGDPMRPQRRLSHDAKPVTPYHEQLVRERTALEAKLVAARKR